MIIMLQRRILLTMDRRFHLPWKKSRTQNWVMATKINRNSVKIVLMFAIGLELVGIIAIFADNIV